MLYLLMRLKMKTIFSIFSFLLLLFFLIYLKYAVQQFFNPKVILGKGGGYVFSALLQDQVTLAMKKYSDFSTSS